MVDPAVDSVLAPVTVAPLLITDSPDAVAEVLAAAGLSRRLSSAGGGWHDLTADEAYARTLLVENPDHPEDADTEADLPGHRL